MNWIHPFIWLPNTACVPAFIALVVFTLAVGGLMLSNGRLKRQGTGQKGIVDFELVGTLDGARAILEGWGAQGRLIAGLNLGMDYLYLVAYSSAISLGVVLAAECLVGQSPVLGLVGVVLAWAQFGAALLDAVENYALIRLLLGSERAWWPPLARWCAIPKFAIVIAGLVYLIVGGGIALAWC